MPLRSLWARVRFILIDLKVVGRWCRAAAVARNAARRDVVFTSCSGCSQKNGSSKNSLEDVATEDTETPLAARKAADEDCALRRKPSLMHGIMEDERNYFGWKDRRLPFGNLLPCRTKCVSVYSVVTAPTKFFEVPIIWICPRIFKRGQCTTIGP